MNETYTKLNISNLKLDKDNPRLPKSKQLDDLDEKVIIDWMLLEASTLELMRAIGENGFFAGEQLLVVPDSKGEGDFIVVEGNRRLTAVKLLSNPELAKVKKNAIIEILNETTERPKDIPCLVFGDKNEILKYLGFRHITGIKSWRLLEKSRYLNELRNTTFQQVPFSEACVSIAKTIGSTGSYIKRLLISYGLYIIIEDEGFYGIEGLNDTKFYLNYIVDSLNRENIRGFIGVDLQNDKPLDEVNKGNLKEITHWWFEKKEGVSRVLGDSKSLSALDSVIASENAFKAFKNGVNLFEAVELTDEINVLFRKTVEKSLKYLEQADSLSTKVSEFYDELYDDLKVISKIAVKIKDFQEKMKKDGDDF
jgi:hypothetical protein